MTAVELAAILAVAVVAASVLSVEVGAASALHPVAERERVPSGAGMRVQAAVGGRVQHRQRRPLEQLLEHRVALLANWAHLGEDPALDLEAGIEAWCPLPICGRPDYPAARAVVSVTAAWQHRGCAGAAGWAPQA